MVLIGTVPAGHSVAFAVADRPTPEDLERLRAIQAMPGLVDVTWTGRPGEDSR